MANRGKWTPETLRAEGWLPLDDIIKTLLDDEGIVIARDKAAIRNLQAAGELKVRVRRVGVDVRYRNVAFYGPETLGQLRTIFLTKHVPGPIRKGYALAWLRRQSEADQLDRTVGGILETAARSPEDARAFWEEEDRQRGVFRDFSPEQREAFLASAVAADQDPQITIATRILMDVVDDRIPAADVLNTGIETALTYDSIAKIYGDRVTGDRPYWPVVVSVLQALTNQVRDALVQRNETEAFWMVTQMSKALAGLRASLLQPQPATEPTTKAEAPAAEPTTADPITSKE